MTVNALTPRADSDPLMLIKQFKDAATARKISVIPVAGPGELQYIYQKCGGGMPDVLNTIAYLGTVTPLASLQITQSFFYQCWITAAFAVAENGAVWIHGTGYITPTLPCRQLVVALDSSNIVRTNSNASVRLAIGNQLYPLHPALADNEKITTAGWLAESCVIYLIDRSLSPSSDPVCGPRCQCWQDNIPYTND